MMGFYTPGPNKGKVQYLIDTHIDGKTTIERLKERGYDITTLKFKIGGPK